MVNKSYQDSLSFYNPFNFHGPTKPQYYANREDLLSTFRHNIKAVSRSRGITRPINIAITGSWGMGKTSTLLKFEDIIKNENENAGIFSATVSLRPDCCTDSDVFFTTIMESIFREYKSTVPLPDQVVDFIKKELNVIENWKITKISLSPEIERKEKTSIKGIQFKDTLIKFWNQLHSSGIDLIVIMLDDIHYTLSVHETGDMLFDLRTYMQGLSAAGTQYMFIITGPTSLYPVIRDKAEPFTRLFERFELDYFNVNGTRQLIYKPLEVEGIDFRMDNEVLEKIHLISGGHPYFITLIMQELLNYTNSGNLTMAEFNKFCPTLLDRMGRVKFNEDYERASETEKQLLLKMATLESDYVTPSMIAGSSSTRLMERLVKKGLLIKVMRGKYRLYNPLFGEYLKRLK